MLLFPIVLLENLKTMKINKILSVIQSMNTCVCEVYACITDWETVR